MLENLLHGGFIEKVEFDKLRHCRAVMGDSPFGRDINVAIEGTTALSNLLRAESFTTEVQSCLPKTPPLERRSLLRRLATAASGLYRRGGGGC